MKSRLDRNNKKKFEKNYRYSIRKFNVGVGSVAIASFLTFMGAQNVSANTFTNQSENQPDEVSVSVTSSSQEETEVVTNNVTDYKKRRI